jgi:RNA polymerase primary sigma factor
MPQGLSNLSEFLKVRKKPALYTDDGDQAVMRRFLHDMRRFSVLSRDREQALAKQIQDSRDQWQSLLLEHLLHIPLLLAWWPRIRRGHLQMTAVCHPKGPTRAQEFRATLQRLHHLRCQMHWAMRQHDACSAERVPALQATMRALLADWEWQQKFLLRAWQRFDRAMTMAAADCCSRHAVRYTEQLGYSLRDLRPLWRDLTHPATLMEQAKQEMVTRNLRLVVSVASKFHYTGLPLSDLIQEGTIGLMRAVDGFDYRRNLKFSTYAIWWIRQAIHRAGSSQTLLRFPEYLRENGRRVREAHDVFLAEHGRPPTTQELSQRSEVPATRIERSLAYAPEAISIDSTLPGQNRALSDLLPDLRILPSSEMVIQRKLRRYTQRALGCLTAREADIICRRFGLDDRPAETLEQIGDALHISRERVRQITLGALNKLKQHEAMFQAALEQDQVSVQQS